MKLGLFATLTGLAVALAATKRKQPRPLPATTGKTTTPQARRSPSPVTGTAPQEGTEAPAAAR